jgi:hypothetical protein
MLYKNSHSNMAIFYFIGDIIKYNIGGNDIRCI